MDKNTHAYAIQLIDFREMNVDCDHPKGKHVGKRRRLRYVKARHRGYDGTMYDKYELRARRNWLLNRLAEVKHKQENV